MPVIQASDVTYQYAPNRGVCGVSLSVDAGTCYGLIGRNGSGKTTLTQLLLGLLRSVSGSLSVLGVDVIGGQRDHLARCGFATDKPVFWENLTGRVNTYFVARSYGLSDKQIDDRLDSLFAQADLLDYADKLVAEYSFGMRRKLSIIQAIIHEPELLILDEPTAGLDAHFVVTLSSLIRQRSEKGLTTWLAGNDLDFVAEVTTLVAFMDAGRIVKEDAPGRLVAEISGSQEVRIELQGPIDLSPPGWREVISFDQNGCDVTAVVQNDSRLVGRLIQWVIECGGKLRTVDVRRPTLRDAFLRATGKGIDK